MIGFDYLSPYTWAATLIAVVSLGIYLFRRNQNRKGGPVWKEKNPD